jgi:RNA polymerase sigma factor (sigma-70 family)
MRCKSEQVARYEGLVRSVATEFFLPGGDVDDLLQAGRLAAARAVETYDASRGASEQTFVALAVRRAMISAVTAAARQKHHPVTFSRRFAELDDAGGSVGDTIADVADPFPGPEAVVIARDEATRLLRHLAQLSWGALEWRCLPYVLDGSSCGAAARELGVAVKSADNTFQRIRSKARAVLTARDIHGG